MNRSSRLLIGLVVLFGGVGSGGGCIPTTTEAAFLESRQEVSCDGVFPVCQGKYAGCVLGEDQFMRGSFPGSRKFLVETGPGDWKIKILLFLDRQRAPGTETEVSWFEPGCSDQYRYEFSKETLNKDLFEVAGRDKVFEVEKNVVEPGDHLVELFSDATVRYALRVSVERQTN